MGISLMIALAIGGHFTGAQSEYKGYSEDEEEKKSGAVSTPDDFMHKADEP